jgi:hypothetical protein
MRWRRPLGRVRLRQGRTHRGLLAAQGLRQQGHLARQVVGLLASWSASPQCCRKGQGPHGVVSIQVVPKPSFAAPTRLAPSGALFARPARTRRNVPASKRRAIWGALGAYQDRGVAWSVCPTGLPPLKNRSRALLPCALSGLYVSTSNSSDTCGWGAHRAKRVKARVVFTLPKWEKAARAAAAATSATPFAPQSPHVSPPRPGPWRRG